MKAILLFILMVSSATARSQHTISVTDELQTFSDFSLLPFYRSGTTIQQVSTYDREGKNDDGFSGRYSFIRREANGSLVMFEAKGPGVINRIWTPTPTEDTLDIYIDDSVFSIQYSDLFSGKIKPFENPLCGTALGGNYCYYPMLFQDSVRIVSRGKKLQFHQVQWRQYPTGTIVKKGFTRFTPRENVATSPFKIILLNKQRTNLLFHQQSGGRIHSIKLFPAAAFSDRKVWLRITYDNEKVPAVFCPVADFLGFDSGKPSMAGWLLGVQNDTAYCHLPMPFDNNCKVELIHNGTTPVQLKYSVISSGKRRDVGREGKLYTSYGAVRYNRNDGPHVLLNTTGKGHLVGSVLHCQGTEPGMTLFFEGDDSTVVDGRLTLHGTGSEDYFNGGWYAFPDRWDDALSLPFHGSLYYNLAYCRTGAYRFYLSDKIPFEKSLYHSIEHGPVGNNIPAVYTSLTFYYGSEPPAALKTNAKPFVPDTLNIYPQLNPVTVWSGADVKSLWAHDTGGLSYVYTVSDDTNLRFSLDELEEGQYEMFADYDRLPTGTQVKVMQRQEVIKDYFDTFSPDTSRAKIHRVGVIQKTKFLNTLTLHFRTTANKNQFFLNRFVLVRKTGNTLTTHR